MVSWVGQQLGNYRLIRLLGEGGFAQVYLGEHIYLGTQAAIKVLHAQLADKDVTVSFNQEARLIAQLKHPHIVRTLDFGVTESTPFLAMDYAPQGTLRQRYPKGSKIPLDTIVTYVEQIAEGLQYAHERKIIHRDIKPENMLIGRRGEILLSDFGIAVVAHSTRSQSVENLAGTIAYMSPEQIQGKPRPASDQYSLGVVVYEWLCGERPFEGTFAEIAAQHAALMPHSLRGHMHISQEIEQVIFKALAKDPAQRFACVKDFAEALQQAYKAEYAVTQRADASHALQNNSVQLKREGMPVVSSFPQKMSVNSLSQMGTATPPASLPPSLIPPPPPITKQSPQPRRKPKPPAVLPLRRGKLKFVDLFVILGYRGLFLLLILYFAYFRSLASVIFEELIFIVLVCTMMILAGPLLGRIRGTLAAFLSCVGIVLYAQGWLRFDIYSQSGSLFLWVLANWVVITFFIGWIYEKRKTRNFMLSWGILTLGAAIILSPVLIANILFSNNTQDPYAIAGTIAGFIFIAFILSFIATVLEAVIQAITVLVVKKRQHT